MKRLKIAAGVAAGVIVLFLVGMLLPVPKPRTFLTPVIVTHPKLDLKINLEPFIREFNCSVKDGKITCPELREKYKCSELGVNHDLGGLGVPILECYSHLFPHRTLPLICKEGVYFLQEPITISFSTEDVCFLGVVKNRTKIKEMSSRNIALYEYDFDIHGVVKGTVNEETPVIAWIKAKEIPFNTKLLVCGKKDFYRKSEAIWISRVFNLSDEIYSGLLNGTCRFLTYDIYGGGCLVPVSKSFIAYINNSFIFISSREKFKKIFTPIDSKEKAFSYAVALTNYFPEWDLSIPHGWIVYQPVLHTSYAEESGEGYRIYLYGYQACGCGLHPYYSVELLVKRNGEIETVSTKDAFVDPSWVACVD